MELLVPRAASTRGQERGQETGQADSGQHHHPCLGIGARKSLQGAGFLRLLLRHVLVPLAFLNLRKPGRCLWPQAADEASASMTRGQSRAFNRH